MSLVCYISSGRTCTQVIFRPGIVLVWHTFEELALEGGSRMYNLYLAEQLHHLF